MGTYLKMPVSALEARETAEAVVSFKPADVGLTSG